MLDVGCWMWEVGARKRVSRLPTKYRVIALLSSRGALLVEHPPAGCSVLNTQSRVVDGTTATPPEPDPGPKSSEISLVGVVAAQTDGTQIDRRSGSGSRRGDGSEILVRDPRLRLTVWKGGPSALLRCNL
jgi:hypothetical protein